MLNFIWFLIAYFITSIQFKLVLAQVTWFAFVLFELGNK